MMRSVLLMLFTVTIIAGYGQTPLKKSDSKQFAGNWELVTVKSVNGDSVAYPYGEHPAGSMWLGSDGYYSIQIYGEGRSRIVSGNKNTATPEENTMLVKKSNAHYGSYSINVKDSLIVFKPDHAFYPNWEGEELKQQYVLKNNQLTYSSAVSTFGASKSVVTWRKK